MSSTRGEESTAEQLLCSSWEEGGNFQDSTVTLLILILVTALLICQMKTNIKSANSPEHEPKAKLKVVKH